MVSSRRVDIDSLLDKAKAIIKGSALFVSNKELARLYSIDDKPVRSSCIGQILRDRLTDTQLEKMKKRWHESKRQPRVERKKEPLYRGATPSPKTLLILATVRVIIDKHEFPAPVFIAELLSYLGITKYTVSSAIYRYLEPEYKREMSRLQKRGRKRKKF